MASLSVLCEGSTEVHFVRKTLQPHLRPRGVHAKPIDLGGGLSWKRLADQVNMALGKRRAHEWVTTMIDLYKVLNIPDLPECEGVGGLPKAEALEQEVSNRFGRANVIPYIQVHEFEALVFVDLEELLSVFPDGEAEEALPRLAKAVAGMAPEEIDDGPQTAPSKRLIAEVPSYRQVKATAGPDVVAQIGLARLREACPHFNMWISRLESLTK